MITLKNKLFATLLLCVPCLALAQTEPTATGFGRTHDQLLDGLREYFPDLKKCDRRNHQLEWEAFTADRTARISLIGSADDVHSAEVTIGLAPRRVPTKEHRTICFTLLKNACPHWVGGEDWLEAAGRDWVKAVGPDWNGTLVGDIAVWPSIVPLEFKKEGNALLISFAFTLNIKKLTQEQLKGVKEELDLEANFKAARWRTWTTADGKHKLEAKFLTSAAGTLTLEKRDGTTIAVKAEILSQEDQDFVRERKWQLVPAANVGRRIEMEVLRHRAQKAGN